MMPTCLTSMLPLIYMGIDCMFRNMHHLKPLILKKPKNVLTFALAAIRAVTGLQRDAIFIKTRAKQTGTNQHTKQSTASKRFIVQEGMNAKILVNLTDYLDTGLFLTIARFVFESPRKRVASIS